ncbi:hypothetical protein [Flavilitoribacter nigricans]|nr:hypothetical protein [Flavilitoribacter nigricans]
MVRLTDLFFFEKISGINSNVSFGDVSLYEDYKDFKMDRDQWLSWFKENKCKISDKDVKLIEQSVIDDTPWIK